jgi:hypothetical protein
MPPANNDSAEESTVVKQYEALRGAAISGALPPESRSGLMLFLRRGMWGARRAATAKTTFEQPVNSRISNWKVPEEYRTIIHIFAAMAIRTSNYRTRTSNYRTSN